MCKPKIEENPFPKEVFARGGVPVVVYEGKGAAYLGLSQSFLSFLCNGFLLQTPVNVMLDNTLGTLAGKTQRKNT